MQANDGRLYLDSQDVSRQTLVNVKVSWRNITHYNEHFTMQILSLMLFEYNSTVVALLHFNENSTGFMSN